MRGSIRHTTVADTAQSAKPTNAAAWNERSIDFRVPVMTAPAAAIAMSDPVRAMALLKPAAVAVAAGVSQFLTDERG